VTPTLRATAASNLTAEAAIAWFVTGMAGPRAAEPGSGARSNPRVVGYALSPHEAAWLLLDSDGHPRGATAVDLSTAYEMWLFDGERELRWLHEESGLGRTVALADDGVPLPAGQDVSDDRLPRPVEPARRILAGEPHPREPGWTQLRSARYGRSDVPCEAGAGQTVVLESVDYVVEDTHGNLTVVDTRLARLIPVDTDRLRVKDHAGTDNQAGTDEPAAGDEPGAEG
jgi:CRISPR-associated protein (TIGR03984 family)